MSGEAGGGLSVAVEVAGWGGVSVGRGGYAKLGCGHLAPGVRDRSTGVKGLDGMTREGNEVVVGWVQVLS